MTRKHKPGEFDLLKVARSAAIAVIAQAAVEPAAAGALRGMDTVVTTAYNQQSTQADALRATFDVAAATTHIGAFDADAPCNINPVFAAERAWSQVSDATASVKRAAGGLRDAAGEGRVVLDVLELARNPVRKIGEEIRGEVGNAAAGVTAPAVEQAVGSIVEAIGAIVEEKFVVRSSAARPAQNVGRPARGFTTGMT